MLVILISRYLMNTHNFAKLLSLVPPNSLIREYLHWPNTGEDILKIFAFLFGISTNLFFSVLSRHVVVGVVYNYLK